jgi:RsiW-degrading membrane proteinase PrsW (M82 family)
MLLRTRQFEGMTATMAALACLVGRLSSLVAVMLAYVSVSSKGRLLR